MKTCTKCRLEKPPEGFSANRHKKDGLQSWCRDCTQEVIYANRAKPGGRDRLRKTSRARGRAAEALIRRHPEEFEALLTAERIAEGLSAIPWERSA